MKALTEDQIEFIRSELIAAGITLPGLSESLLDHICCLVESRPDLDFNEAYKAALECFGEQGLKKTEQETIYLLNLKREIIMKKTMYVTGYIAAAMITTGLLFKTQHWPGASILLVLGTGVLNFGFLPMFFYQRYKKDVALTGSEA